jgi:hypothetical protein
MDKVLLSCMRIPEERIYDEYQSSGWGGVLESIGSFTTAIYGSLVVHHSAEIP